MDDTRITLTHPLRTDEVLSPAETRIAEGYTAGLIGKEIASACRISPNTVIKHTQNIYDKTGIKRSTNALVAWFLSVNVGIDLRDLERRFGAFLLLCLFSFQMVATDPSSNSFMRRAPRRTEARRSSGRRGRRDDELDITSLIS